MLWCIKGGDGENKSDGALFTDEPFMDYDEDDDDDDGIDYWQDQDNAKQKPTIEEYVRKHVFNRSMPIYTSANHLFVSFFHFVFFFVFCFKEYVVLDDQENVSKRSPMPFKSSEQIRRELTNIKLLSSGEPLYEAGFDVRENIMAAATERRHDRNHRHGHHHHHHHHHNNNNNNNNNNNSNQHNNGHSQSQQQHHKQERGNHQMVRKCDSKTEIEILPKFILNKIEDCSISKQTTTTSMNGTNRVVTTSLNANVKESTLSLNYSGSRNPNDMVPPFTADPAIGDAAHHNKRSNKYSKLQRVKSNLNPQDLIKFTSGIGANININVDDSIRPKLSNHSIGLPADIHDKFSAELSNNNNNNNNNGNGNNNSHHQLSRIQRTKYYSKPNSKN